MGDCVTKISTGIFPWICESYTWKVGLPTGGLNGLHKGLGEDAGNLYSLPAALDVCKTITVHIFGMF